MHVPRGEEKTGNTELHKGRAHSSSLTKVAEIIVHTGGINMLILDLHVLFPRVHEMGFLEWHYSCPNGRAGSARPEPD